MIAKGSFLDTSTKCFSEKKTIFCSKPLINDKSYSGGIATSYTFENELVS